MIEEFRAQPAPGTLTRENHPENRPEPPAPGGTKRSTLPRSIALSILGGMIGMIYGATALSSTLALDEPASLLSVLPMVVVLVALQAAYWAAIVCMGDGEGEN